MKLITSIGVQIIPYRERADGGRIGDIKTAVFIPKDCLVLETKEDRLDVMESDAWIFTLNRKKEFVRSYAPFFVGRFCDDRRLVPSTDTLIRRIANKYIICKDMNVFTSVLLEYSRELQNWKTHVLHEI